MTSIPKIAAAYVRVSTDDQVEYSPDAQMVEIQRYAKNNGYIIPDQYIFVDEGISGKHTEKREAFNRMIGVAKTKPKPFDAVLLWKFSRFARNREDSIVYKSMLRRQLGIDVISISEPVGDDKMSIIIEAMIEAMDEYYSINLAEEVRRGMSEKARRGELQSTPSFGYAVKDNTLVPIEPEASYVKEIFHHYLDGMGLSAIAKWLNAQGVTTHRGNKFENRTIEYILRNPVYIGKLRWNPAGRSRRKFDDPNIILADAGHQTIIDTDTWTSAQERMKEQKALRPYHARPTYDRKDWASGIVRCAACGGTLIFAKPHYMKCNNYVRGRCTFTQHVTTEALHEAIIRRLKYDAASPTISFDVIRRNSNAESELERISQELSALSRKKARLRDAYLNGADSVEEYKEAKSIISEQEDVLREKAEKLRAADQQEDITEKLREKILACVSILEAPDLGVDKKYEAANAIIKNCTFSKADNLLRITYRIIL